MSGILRIQSTCKLQKKLSIKVHKFQRRIISMIYVSTLKHDLQEWNIGIPIAKPFEYFTSPVCFLMQTSSHFFSILSNFPQHKSANSTKPNEKFRECAVKNSEKAEIQKIINKFGRNKNLFETLDFFIAKAFAKVYFCIFYYVLHMLL